MSVWAAIALLSTITTKHYSSFAPVKMLIRLRELSAPRFSRLFFKGSTIGLSPLLAKPTKSSREKAIYGVLPGWN